MAYDATTNVAAPSAPATLSRTCSSCSGVVALSEPLFFCQPRTFARSALVATVEHGYFLASCSATRF